ncbi:MAG TPA: Fic family protein [Bacilli bacterium]|nr:Fic family protein [Bacilli bacterium]
MYHPQFSYTHSIVKDLMSIERSRAIVELMPVPAHIERNLKEQAKLKMTHYSTRIEGNTLDLEQVTRVVKQKQDQTRIPVEEEVRNYWEALSFLAREKQKSTLISENFIQKLHSIIVQHGTGRKPTKSKYRGATPPGILFAVYDNLTKKPEYIPPEYSDVPILMEQFIEWIQKEKSLPIPVKAAIMTYQFLTIHPFEDGNGRTARALASYLLSTSNYDVKGFYSMEEYYVEDLQGYYKHLQMGLPPLYYDGRNNPKDLAPWVGYFVRIMALAYEKVANLAERFATNNSDTRITQLEPNEKTLLRYLIAKQRPVKPKEIADMFQVHPRTISKWAVLWMEKGIIESASGEKRITSYKLGTKYLDITLNHLGYRDNFLLEGGISFEI